LDSLFNHQHADSLLNRLDKLNESSPALWGKMKVDQMLAHCQQPLKMALGKLSLKPNLIGILFGKLVYKMISGDKEFKKNLPTPKEFIIRESQDFEINKKKLIELISRFPKHGPLGLTTKPHPFFGKLTPHEWDALQWKHLDHHFRQFGV